MICNNTTINVCFETLPVQTGDSETEILEEKKNKSYKFTDVRGDLCIDSKVLMQKGHRLNCKLPAIGGTQECWFSKMKDVKKGNCYRQKNED